MADNPKLHPKHSVLLVAPNRKKLVVVFFVLMVVTFSVMITGHIDGKTDWKNLILPILACGFMGLLIPSSEVWRYTSWQDFPERKEKIVLQREKNEKK